jgi:hypothetical protein
MVEYLTDLQLRNIRTNTELGINGVFSLGDEVLAVLRKLVYERQVTDAFFTHYFEPPQTEPHVKVGIRYQTLDDLNLASSALDDLCYNRSDLVIDKGKFEPTKGEYDKLPEDIVVDYVVCCSFKFLVKAKDELGSVSPAPDRVAKFLIRHKRSIDEELLHSKDIFRDEENARPLRSEEIPYVMERFVHHFCNAIKCTSDCEIVVWRILHEG